MDMDHREEIDVKDWLPIKTTVMPEIEVITENIILVWHTKICDGYKPKGD
jgi:hypothetical protein